MLAKEITRQKSELFISANDQDLFADNDYEFDENIPLSTSLLDEMDAEDPEVRDHLQSLEDTNFIMNLLQLGLNDWEFHEPCFNEIF